MKTFSAAAIRRRVRIARKWKNSGRRVKHPRPHWVLDAESLRPSSGRWGKEPDGGSEAINDLFSADQSEYVEQARAYQLSRHCHTNRMNQRSRLHTPSIGDRSQGRLGRRRIESRLF